MYPRYGSATLKDAYRLSTSKRLLKKFPIQLGLQLQAFASLSNNNERISRLFSKIKWRNV